MFFPVSLWAVELANRGPGCCCCPPVSIAFAPHPVSRQHRRIVRRLAFSPYAPRNAGRVHQSRLALQHPLAPQYAASCPEVAPRRQRISWLQSVEASLPGRTAYSATKASRLACISLEQPLLGADLKANPKRCIQFRQLLGGVQLETAEAESDGKPPGTSNFQYQLAIPMPDRSGRLLHRGLSIPPAALGQGGGEPPVEALREYQGCRPSLAEGLTPIVPIVCGSLSRVSTPMAAAVQPWASSSTAYHLSRSLGVQRRQDQERVGKFLVGLANRKEEVQTPLPHRLAIKGQRPRNRETSSQFQLTNLPRQLHIPPWLWFSYVILPLMLTCGMYKVQLTFRTENLPLAGQARGACHGQLASVAQGLPERGAAVGLGKALAH